MVIRCIRALITCNEVSLLTFRRALGTIKKSNDILETFIRGSGPGGQSINKTMNCVQLKHVPTGIIVNCQKSRYISSYVYSSNVTTSAET